MNLWTYPTLPAASNGVTFTADGDGVHMEGSTDRWALLSVTAHLTAGDYTLTGTDSDDYRCYLRNDSIHGDNWRPLSTSRSQPVREATLPEADYQLTVEVGDGVSQVNVDTTILPFLTQL